MQLGVGMLISRPHLDWVEVGCHDDLVQWSCQPRGQFGLPLQPLWSGVVVQPHPRKEVVDYCYTVMLAWKNVQVEM